MNSRIPILLAALIMLAPVSAFAQSSMPAARPDRKGDPDQWYQAPSTIHGKTILVPIGTTWEGRIDQTISSSRSRPGTAFNIILSTPVILNGTEVVVPAGSAILGEVVEAVPAAQVPKQLMQDKRLIRGKLRIAISGLRTPDGVTHPLVASVAGEVNKNRNNYSNDTGVPLGTGVAYVGSQGSFEAVNVNRSKQRYTGSGSQDQRPPLIKKRELLADQLYGAGEDGYKKDNYAIRSLVLKGRDYWIYSGSPMTVRLQAPFKISVNAPGMGAPVGSVQEVDDELPPPTKASAGYGGGGEPAPGFSNRPQQGGPPGRSAPIDSF
jgi:hypothetical protein